MTEPMQPECRCYVRRLTEEARFSLRYGAHALTCPVYRPSLDPVDRRADEELRREADLAELGQPDVSADLAEIGEGRRALGGDRLREFEFEDAAIDGWED